MTYYYQAVDGYTSWTNMRARCNNPTSDRYPFYGARGIRVCKRWDSFKSFMEDMGPRPSKAHSIDRIDNNGHYEPGNCRWATKKEQARNRRSSKFLEHGGVSKTAAEWAELAGVSQSTLCEAMVTRGMSLSTFLERHHFTLDPSSL